MRVSKGGNYLLNVGPTAEGQFPAPHIQRLAEIGQWMKVNGEAIHGTTPGPFPKAPAWGRVTQKPGKFYLHVFDWPKDGQLVVPGLTAKIQTAYLLAAANRAALKTTDNAGGVEVAVPAHALLLPLPQRIRNRLWFGRGSEIANFIDRHGQFRWSA